MAEIKIEKKKPVWPWILLTLIILGIIAFLVYQNQADDDYSDDYNSDTIDRTDTITNSTSYEETPNTVDDGSSAMMALMAAMKDSTRFGADSTYTKTALQNLAKVTVAKAKIMEVETSSALTDLEQYAMMNTSTDGDTTTTSNMASNFKEVSNDIVSVIEALGKKTTATMNDQVTKLKATANKINASTTLDKQQPTIQAFFRQAHDVLHNMNS